MDATKPTDDQIADAVKEACQEIADGGGHEVIKEAFLQIGSIIESYIRKRGVAVTAVHKRKTAL